MNAHELSAGVFIRGLSNLKTQLTKAEAQVVAGGGDASALLNARLPQEGRTDDAAGLSPFDLHTYTLAAQVHWAAEGARLAMARLLAAPAVPATSDAETFPALHQRIDATIAGLRGIAASDIEAGLGRSIVVEHRRGAVTADGSRFLLAYAIPHFFYHLTSAYGILRTQGVQLTMGDFLGNWGASM